MGSKPSRRPPAKKNGLRGALVGAAVAVAVLTVSGIGFVVWTYTARAAEARREAALSQKRAEIVAAAETVLPKCRSMPLHSREEFTDARAFKVKGKTLLADIRDKPVGTLWSSFKRVGNATYTLTDPAQRYAEATRILDSKANGDEPAVTVFFVTRTIRQDQMYAAPRPQYYAELEVSAVYWPDLKPAGRCIVAAGPGGPGTGVLMQVDDSGKVVPPPAPDEWIQLTLWIDALPRS